ncbi:MAG: PD40 domain-containing protein [Bacteroidetes bacterium]|nr:PD40 domain-containing protein [Bacteroidota bacterium]MCA6443963.1 PD40 domain-containing protein [Bacteroidota bacterium]
MKNKIVILLLFSIGCINAQEEKTNTTSKKGKKTNAVTDVGDAAKFLLAKQKILGGQYVSALNTLLEIERNSPNDSKILYYLGECHFALKQFDKAKDKLNKAVEANTNLNPRTYLVLGKLLQLEENFDQAIDYFKKFLGTPNISKEEIEEATTLSSQCNNAKTYMTSPLVVEVINLGPEINSIYDDKNPCITADGKKLVFTSRRPKTTNSETDVEGDGKYFEDIYITSIDSITRNFGKPTDVPGSINTLAHDACTSISPDGKQIFIYKNDLKDKESRGGDVFVSKISNGKWRTPEPVGKPIASSYWEGGACISSDGKKYFFTSEREGGFGGSDIWMVERKNKKEWGKPVNLGNAVNSSYDEAGMFLAPDGKTLFFCSNGPNSMGSYDVFKTVFENGAWSKPTNLGYPINTSAKEGQLTVSADAKFAYLSSERKGSLGESDVYKIDLKDYAILEKDGKKKISNGLSIIKGVVRDGYEGYGLPEAEVVLTDSGNSMVASTLTNENGEYFFTLKGGEYTITIKKKGFKEQSEKINLPQSTTETISLEKGYLLKK